MFPVQWLPDKRSDSVTPSNWIAPYAARRRHSFSGPRYSTLLYFTPVTVSRLSHFLSYSVPSSLLLLQSTASSRATSTSIFDVPPLPLDALYITVPFLSSLLPFVSLSHKIVRSILHSLMIRVLHALPITR
jgi:hypothetical protein